MLLATYCSNKCNNVVKNGILCDFCDKYIHSKRAKLIEEYLPDENEK